MNTHPKFIKFNAFSAHADHPEICPGKVEHNWALSLILFCVMKLVVPLPRVGGVDPSFALVVVEVPPHTG